MIMGNSREHSESVHLFAHHGFTPTQIVEYLNRLRAAYDLPNLSVKTIEKWITDAGWKVGN